VSASETEASPRAAASSSGVWVAALGLVAVILPRLIRMAWPRVQIEDDNYLYSAYLIHRGQTPYHDFVQANPPLLEQLTAPLFSVFGAHYRVGEALSALAILATAAALWRLGTRMYGLAAGLAAAVLYSWMPLVFRYHLYEREVYSLAASSVGLALAFWARSAAPERPGSGRCTLLLIAAGALFAVAFHCKQVGLFPGSAFVLDALLTGEVRVALIAGGAMAAVGGGLLALDVGLYGPDVLLQSFALHLIKGAPLPFGLRLTRLAAELGPLLPLVAIGLWARRRDAATRFLSLWIGLELLFMLLISSTFWPHYMVPLLAPLVLLGAGALQPRTRKLGAVALAAGLALLAVQSSANPQDRLGFGGVGREALARTAQLVQSLVPPDSDALLCPPVVALEADRIKLYNYIDTLGFTRQLQAAYREGRLRAFLRNPPAESFGRTLARANATWVPEALDAVRSGRVLAVIPEGELPIPVEALVAAGYWLVDRNPWFDLYASPALRPATP